VKKIYIDGLGLVDGHFSGIGQYILGILRGIDQLLSEAETKQQPMPQVKVIIPRDEVKKFKKFNFKHIGYKKFPLPFRYMAALWHRNWLPPVDLICGRGVYIFPRFVSYRLWFSKYINVVFDLSYELHREFSDDGNAKFLSKGVARTIKKSQKVITISQNAKRELKEFYKLSDSQISVATPATDPAVFYRRNKTEIERVKQKYGIKGDYILALSNLEPRKNLGALVDVYCRLPKEVTKKTALLLVGVSGWKTDDLFNDIVEKVDMGANIIRPSKYVVDADRAAIISGAKMLVYPSHYEGFGMPPLEALACGVPVISANNSSLPEVVKGVAPMVDGNDRDALYAEVIKLFKDLEQRARETSEAGPRRAAEFSWIKSAEMFLNTVKEAEK
jgi:alpha-1,3-rhamnosyl/mannosyltransferase